MSAEQELQQNLVKYVEATYPTVIHRSDLAGVPLHPKTARDYKPLKKPNFKYPDFSIDKMVGGYGGLRLELKTGIDKLYLKRGGWYGRSKSTSLMGYYDGGKNHVEGQYKALCLLANEGYACAFACGLGAAKALVDAYLHNDFEANWTDKEIRLVRAGEIAIEDMPDEIAAMSLNMSLEDYRERVSFDEWVLQ